MHANIVAEASIVLTYLVVRGVFLIENVMSGQKNKSNHIVGLH